MSGQWVVGWVAPLSHLWRTGVDNRGLTLFRKTSDWEERRLHFSSAEDSRATGRQEICGEQYIFSTTRCSDEKQNSKVNTDFKVVLVCSHCKIGAEQPWTTRRHQVGWWIQHEKTLPEVFSCSVSLLHYVDLNVFLRGIQCGYFIPMAAHCHYLRILCDTKTPVYTRVI